MLQPLLLRLAVCISALCCRNSQSLDWSVVICGKWNSFDVLVWVLGNLFPMEDRKFEFTIDENLSWDNDMISTVCLKAGGMLQFHRSVTEVSNTFQVIQIELFPHHQVSDQFIHSSSWCAEIPDRVSLTWFSVIYGTLHPFENAGEGLHGETIQRFGRYSIFLLLALLVRLHLNSLLYRAAVH